MTSIPSESETLTKRTYQDLLDLEMSCPVVASQESVQKRHSSLLSVDTDPDQSSSGKDLTDTFQERQIVDAIGLRVMGFIKNDKFEVFSRFHKRTVTIENINKLTINSLLSICGPVVKQRVQNVNVDGIPGIYSISEVREAISLLAGFQVITPQTKLGVGVWQGKETNGTKHDSYVLISGSDAVEISESSGEIRSINEPRCRGHLLDMGGNSEPWVDFDRLATLMSECDDTFARDTTNALINLFQKWKWAHQMATPLVLAGLVLSSWVQTIWDWRPQIAVVGPSNSGKSTLLNCLVQIFGNLTLSASKSTANGIRQAMKNSAKVVLIDEFEDSKQRNETLEMLRASGRGTEMHRGSANQEVHSFTLRHICWVAAIEVGLNRAADRNRFVMIELESPEKERRGKLKLPNEQELRELGLRSLVVALKYIQKAKIYATKIKDTRVEGVDDRIIESYAVPAAMMSVIQGYDEDGCREILAQMLEGMKQADVGEVKDEANLLEAIFSANIFTGRDTHTVASLINTVTYRKSNFDIAVENLGKYGIAVTTFGDSKEVPDNRRNEPCLAIATTSVRTKLLRGTSWENQSIDQILKRVEGALPLKKYIAKQQHRSICIPMEYLYREMLAHDENFEEQQEF